MGKMRERSLETEMWNAAAPPVGAGSALPGEQRPPQIRVTPSVLVRSLERDVIPRLVLALRTAPADAQPGRPGSVAGAHPGEQDVLDVTAVSLAGDAEDTFLKVESIRLRGVAVEVLFLELLAPVARRLGTMWEEDLCDFTQVTIGLMALQQVMRRISPEFQADAAHRELGCRVLLAPTPGEQHTFGLNMVAEFFRRAGWEVHGGAQASARELTQIVRSNWFAVVGFSLGSETRLGELAQAIRRVRDASCNPQLSVMVGGPIFAVHPDFVARVGADATALDGRDAVLQAHRLLAMMPERA